MSPERPALAAAPGAARSASGPNAGNPAHLVDGRASVPAEPQYRWAEMRKLPAPTAGEFPRRSPARSPGLLAISARPPAWVRHAALGRVVRNLAGPADGPGPARWIERRSRMRAVSARWHCPELAALHGERG